MSATMKRLKDTFTLDEIAGLLGVDSWEKIEDRNPDAWGEYYSHTFRETKAEAIKDGLDEQTAELRAENAAMEAESEARSESYGKWKNAMLHAAETIIGEHKLELRQLKTKQYLYKLVPAETWRDAAAMLRDTINGYGPFYFNNVQEFLDSGPYTARQAVLEHLHWMKDRAEVYGTSNAERLMGDWDR